MKNKKIRIFIVLLLVFIVFFGAIAYPIKMSIPKEGLPSWAWILIIVSGIALFIGTYLLILGLNNRKSR